MVGHALAHTARALQACVVAALGLARWFAMVAGPPRRYCLAVAAPAFRQSATVGSRWRCSAPTTAWPCRPSTRRCSRRSDCCSICVRGRVCTAFCVAPTWWRRPGTACIARRRAGPATRRFLVRPQLRRRARLSPASPATPTARPPQHVMSGAMSAQRAPAHRCHQATGRWCGCRGRPARRACCRCAR